MSLHLPSHISTSKTFNKQTRRLFGLLSENLAGLLTFGIGKEVFHFPRNLELTKIWVSTGRTTGKSNFMNDKGISSTPAASDLMDITASYISLSLTVANEKSGTLFVRDTASNIKFTSSIQQRSRQKIIVQMLHIHLNLGSLRGIDKPQPTQDLVKPPLWKTRVQIY
jgi:hypothetical protein